MRISDISNFVAVVAAGSLVRASNKLGMSQPTLSKSIARLERALGVQLIERHARGVKPTEIGLVFLESARNVHADFQDSLAAIRDYRLGQRGLIRFGVGIGVPHALVADACKAAVRRRPLNLEIWGGMSDSLFQAVEAGDIEFAVAGVKPKDETKLKWRSLFSDPMMPLVQKQHPLASSKRVSWEQLAEENWIVTNVGTTTRNWFDEQFRRRGLKAPAPLLTLRGYPISLDVISGLNAVTLCPVSIQKIAQESFGLQALNTPGDWKSDRVVGIIFRQNAYSSSAAKF